MKSGEKSQIIEDLVHQFHSQNLSNENPIEHPELFNELAFEDNIDFMFDDGKNEILSLENLDCCDVEPNTELQGILDNEKGILQRMSNSGSYVVFFFSKLIGRL
ncbi:unnamed protein product [Arabidopsis thaliana]|uniref:(thale cress) hypothetical protein n=1 Tax=Arabidopsis thaliana TaxID=3702 RepID=A0A7G2EWV2_ARATH|nr:unnamed protein product [Arabidopsis thaliana]